MRVLVCGGRDYDESAFLFEALDELHEQHHFECVIHGAARGADYLAGVWARMERVSEIACPADWKTHGKKAPIRNRFMLETHKPDLVVAFPGGLGTAHMISTAMKAGVKVVRPATPSSKLVPVSDREME